jgi:hypothetical protein
MEKYEVLHRRNEQRVQRDETVFLVWRTQGDDVSQNRFLLAISLGWVNMSRALEVYTSAR